MPRKIDPFADDSVLAESGGGTGVDASQAAVGQVLRGTGNGLELGAPPAGGGVLYRSTADGSVVNTVNETTLIGAGIGSLALLANTITVGQMLRLMAFGRISTDGAAPGSITIRSKLNATNHAVSPTGAVSGGMGQLAWRVILLLTFRTIGAGGTLRAASSFMVHTANSNVGTMNNFDMVAAGVIAVNTTIDQTLNLTAQWTVANANNNIICQNFILESL